MITIERATLDDIPFILPMLLEFHEESLAHYGLGFEPEDAVKTSEHFIEKQVGLLAFMDGKIIGVVAGIVTPYFLNHSTTIFQEAVWFVKKEYRSARVGMELLNLVEKYSDSQGWRLVMANMGNLKNDKLKHFYESRGYELLESQFIRGGVHASV